MIRFEALSTDVVRSLRAGGPDANGQTAERTISDGQGNPCRHCLGFVPEGEGMLICAHRPFGALQPYAETGPIFLCAGDCRRFAGEGLPPALLSSKDYLLKGYGPDERIRYGTGQVVPVTEVADYARQLLDRSDIAFVDVRSARNNCFLARIRKAA